MVHPASLQVDVCQVVSNDFPVLGPDLIFEECALTLPLKAIYLYRNSLAWARFLAHGSSLSQTGLVISFLFGKYRLNRQKGIKLLRRQLSQHVLQNAAVLEVFDFLRGVDADLGNKRFHSSVGGSGFHRERIARSKPAGQ